MPQRIQAPDGSLVEFPDGMSDEQIASVMRREYGGPDTRPKSMGAGLLKGVMKPLDNGAIALEKGAQALGVPTQAVNNIFNTPDTVTMKAQREQAFARAPVRADPVGEFAGNVVGTLPAAVASRNPFAIAASGAIQGGLLTDAKTAGGVATDMAGGAILNYVGGKAVDAVADFIKPAIDPAVRRLKDAGVKITPGMVKGGKAMVREDKMMSRPVVGDSIRAGRQKTIESFNTATANEALKPLGVTVPANVRPGYDTVAATKSTIRDSYDRVIPQLSVQINGQQFAGKLYPSAANLEAPQRKVLGNLLNQHLKNGQLSGKKLQMAHGELRRLAANYSRDPAAPNNELGKVLYEAADELMDAMVAQNPKFAPQLQQTNAAYRGYRVLAGAAKGADDGIFNTSQLKRSVLRGDRSKNGDAAAQGQAFMQGFSNDARQVIPAKTPNSGTADRLNAGNIFATVRGAVDDLGFRADDQLQRLRLAPRPKAATQAAKTVKRLKAPVSTATVASAHQRRD